MRNEIPRGINPGPAWQRLVHALDTSRQINPWKVAGMIAGIYMLLGAMWILLSDKVVARLFHELDMITLISMIKGWVYVLVTGLLIYSLIYIAMKRVKAGEHELLESYEELKAVHEALASSQDFNKSILAGMINAFALHRVVLDESGTPADYEFIDVNAAFEQYTGLKKGDIIGERVRDVIPQIVQDENDWIGLYGKIALTGCAISFDSYSEALGKWYSVNAYSPEKGYFITIFHDISQLKRNEVELREKNDELSTLYEELAASEEELRQQLDELTFHQKMLKISEERYRLAMEGSNDMLWDLDLTTGTAYCSDRWNELMGYGKDEAAIPCDQWKSLLHPEDKELEEQAMAAHIEGKAPFFGCECRLRRKNGEYRWFLARGKVLKDEYGKLVRFAGSLTDIDDRKKFEIKLQDSYRELEETYGRLEMAQQKLEEQYKALEQYRDKLHWSAYHDTLTGLPNRLSLYECLTNEMQQSPAAGKALLFIDSDNFKLINDTMGHSFGDQLIIAISRRLESTLDSCCPIYRIGGDEFIICLYHYTALEEVEQLAGRVLQCFDTPFEIEGGTLHTTVSIGIALYPWHGRDVDGLMKCADIAMYRAKEQGKNQAVLFSSSMNEAVTERMLVEKYLRTALDRNEIMVYYQPQMDIETGKISGLEALLRWNSPVLGPVPPMKFIRIAEETHLIIPMGEWILRNACRFLKQLHLQGHTKLTVAVNVSILQLLQDNFVERVMEILESTGVGPGYLELEVTESILMESYEAIRTTLTQLKKHGIKLALDDFGQGYSSLSYLRQLPIHTLKIDKTFIDNMIREKDCQSLIGGIVMIGRKMGMTILAEGVETCEQLEYLKKCKCHKIQGYLISRPVPQDEVPEILGRWD